jgi:chromosome segregation ATPase
VNNQLIQLLSVVITAVASSGAVAALFNRRNRRERESDIEKANAEADNISAQAAATALAALRKELDAANADLDRRRAIIQGQDERIDSQQRQIRRLRRQIGELKEHGHALEVWVRQVTEALVKAKVEVPPLPNMDWLSLVETEDDDKQT